MRDSDKWNVEQYTREAQQRMQQILEKVGHGGFPMGEINLLSKLPDGVDYPTRDVARKVEEKLWKVIETSKSKSKLLQRYNIILALRQRGKYGFTVTFNFSPDDVRRLTEKGDQE